MPKRSKAAESVDLTSLLNAMPAAVFVVDDDVTILAANQAATRMLGKRPQRILRRLCGEVLGCLHDRDSAKGCGTTQFCAECVIRNSVAKARDGAATQRAHCEMNMVPHYADQLASLFVSVTPFTGLPGACAILVLEDITELVELRRLIPICAKCKKIRTDKEYWEHVDAYLGRSAMLQFTHTVCPDCVASL